MGDRIAALVLVLFLVSGCVAVQEPGGTEEPAESAGGRYNLVLENGMMTYEKDGKTIVTGQMLPEAMKPGLDWLRGNTPEDAVVMSWWDYGHAIRAYAEREPVADAPSKESLTTTVSRYLDKDPEEIECPDCIPHETLQDVAELILADSDTRAIELMNKYGASYLYVHVEDDSKSDAMFIILGQEKRPVSGTLLGKSLAKEHVEGMELLYEDDTCRIYGLM